ncbi:MAG TPA: energy-coupling factor ABC transporter permease [Burkholderiaceae bacterium]|nr:energy-coupling factor ABC transporter permease [Burkholderiaceae bacterium]
MNLLHQSVPIGFAVLGWVLLLPPLAAALWAVRGGLVAPSAAHAWLGGAVAVALLWRLQIGVGDGLHLGMLGSALYALVFGRARGTIGLLLALVLHTLLNDGSWLNLGLNGVLFALLPALVATALQRGLEAKLPHNLFVFIIGNGMFVALATTTATSLVLLALSLPGAAPTALERLDDYVGYTLLLAWGESIVSGMLFSALVIFRPAVVLTFRPDAYLGR